MLMRETASELTFAPEAVERETRRGAVRTARRATPMQLAQPGRQARVPLSAGARFAERLPIGTAETLDGRHRRAACAAFWQREYRPREHRADRGRRFRSAELVEAAIAAHFAELAARPPAAAADAGPDRSRRQAAQTDIYVDPALSERVTVSRHGPWLDEPDTVASRREERAAPDRLRHRQPPARSGWRGRTIRRSAAPGSAPATCSTSARTTNLVVDTVDGEWRRGLAAAQAEYRRALEFGFTEAEVAEQVANLRTALRERRRGVGRHAQQRRA